MKIHSHRTSLVLIALSMTSAIVGQVWAKEGEEHAQASDNALSQSKELDEILVEANEPRYVAPTFRDRIGRIWAPVYLNGKGPFRMVLDTGANSSAIIEPIAKVLNIPIVQTSKVQLRGATGTAMVPIITIDSLEVGELQIKDTRLPIVPAVFGGADGLLGSSGFTDKRIFIDFKNDKIRITRSHMEAAPFGYGRIPLKIGKYQLPMFDLMVGSTKTKAILDTGAQQTAGNLALREALSKRRKTQGPFDVVGVTLDVARVEAMATPSIYLPGATIHNMQVTFGNMYIFEHWDLIKEPAIIIGMDLIGAFDQVIIDYKLRELYIRARTSEPKVR
jgi:predicted aspartyl protease